MMAATNTIAAIPPAHCKNAAPPDQIGDKAPSPGDPSTCRASAANNRLIANLPLITGRDRPSIASEIGNTPPSTIP